ncbi:MAG: M48 family metalloprotease [Hormoscilla sp. GM7CHS1pb]|nr:M48 family metalloprotease [Hormoscilla sp. GM7CHS1pb]
MSTELLQTGVEAVKQGSYSEGIGVLEEVCRRANPRSKDCIKAQMWLVKAYHQTGQSDRAIGLCQEMTESEFTQVQEWANKTLPSLSKKSQTLKPKQVTSATKADSSSQAQAPKEELLEMGSQAIRQKNYAEAIAPLEAFIAACGDTDSKDYQQAQMWLVKAYRRTDRLEEAIAICEQLSTHSDPLITSWVDQTLPTLLLAQTRAAQASESETESSENKEDSFYKFPKAGRSGQTGVKLAMTGIASNLTMASAVTICLLFGMVLALCLFLILIHGSENPTIGLVMSLAIAIAFNAVAFFISPFFMDLMQRWLYGTRWVSLSEIEQYSPETVKVLKTVCSKHKLKQPRLGIIDDENPTAFTYGSLPDSARLVVSQGLFTYLDDEEIAIVYAHELGHIVHWDFAVMTLASTLVQITYLIYIYAREMGERMGNSDTGKKALLSF